MARALLSSPKLLLLDEPLASLDLPLRARIIPYLARIRDEFRVPMLYVTHDRYEALALADEMVVLVGGKVAQAGPVQELFSRPANLAVAGALAVETVLQGSIESRANGLVTVKVGPIALMAVDEALSMSRPLTPALSPDGGEGGVSSNAREVYVCIRAENVVLFKGDNSSSARNHLAGVVRSLGQDGPLVRVELDCGFALTALLTKQSCEEMKLSVGDKVTAQVKAQQVHLIGR
jgi:molybdate transport system ATP-binding protein